MKFKWALCLVCIGEGQKAIHISLKMWVRDKVVFRENKIKVGHLF